MTTLLYEKIAKLPPSLLPRLERMIDSLPTTDNELDGVDDEAYWHLPLYDKDGKKVHPKAGCLKGLIVMKDNYFEPDEDWEEYM
jgi:hypothetical protein